MYSFFTFTNDGFISKGIWRGGAIIARKTMGELFLDAVGG